MPRIGQNKYCQYDRTLLNEAVGKITAKVLSIRAAANTYKIPYSTLRDRVTGRVVDGVKTGGPTVLTKEEETKLSEYLIKVADLGAGKSRKQTMEMAYMIIYHDPTRSKISEKWLKNRSAGKDWYYSFMHRHTELSHRTPEKLSKSRAKMTNDAVLSHFYDVVEFVVRVDGADRMPSTIFNCDEVGIGLDFKPAKVVCSRKTCLWSLNSGDKTNITVMGCGSASGDMIPPLVIYKGKRVNKILRDGAPEGWMVGFSPSDWINAVLFERWFEELFIPFVNSHVRESEEVKVVLLLDGHKSHETLHIIEMAIAHNIDIVCLLPNTTHYLQPLDVSYFKSLKAKWNIENEGFARRNHGKFVNKANFAGIFHSAWTRTNENKEIIKNGFSRTGIAPFRRLTVQDLLKDKMLSPAQGLNRPMPLSDTGSQDEGASTEDTGSQDEGESTEDEVQESSSQGLPNCCDASSTDSVSGVAGCSVGPPDTTSDDLGVQDVLCDLSAGSTKDHGGSTNAAQRDSGSIGVPLDCSEFRLDQACLTENNDSYEQVNAHIGSLLSSMENSLPDIDRLIPNAGSEVSCSECPVSTELLGSRSGSTQEVDFLRNSVPCADQPSGSTSDRLLEQSKLLSSYLPRLEKPSCTTDFDSNLESTLEADVTGGVTLLMDLTWVSLSLKLKQM